MPRTKVTSRYVPKTGSIIRFAPAGKVIETVTVAKGAKPAGAVFTDWEELGCIETGTVAVLMEAGEPVFCFNASTGRNEQINTGDTDADTRLQFEIVAQQVTDFLWQFAFAADSVHADTGAFVPGSMKGGAKQGWIKIQTQVSTEVVVTMDLWVEIKLSNPAQIRDRVAGYKPAFTITQLGASGEAGVLGTPAA
jgi:hypothetical protein